MYSIAIIEDDVPTSDTFKGYLEKKFTCVVHQYVDFASAKEALEQNTFDLVISDNDLGSGSDKYGGAKIAKAINKETPLLIVSGMPQPEMHRELFKALEAWDYLQKPVTEEDFINQVSRALTFREASAKGATGLQAMTDPDLIIDRSGQSVVTWKGERLILSMTQILILETLVTQINKDVPYDDFFVHIRSGKNKANLREYIKQIRRAFKDTDPEFDRIKNTALFGYSWRV